MLQKQFITVALVTFIGLASGCNGRGTTTTVNVNDNSEIATALQNLLQGKGGAGFVIVEEASTGKFVQFAGSATEPLVLNLPVQTLSDAEHARAEEFFAGFPESHDDEDGFRLEFDSDVDEATRVVLQVFRDVYEFEAGMQLTLTSGW